MALFDPITKISPLPEGFIARPVMLEDVEPVTAMFNAYSRQQVGVESHEVDDIRNEWQTPNFDLATDTCTVWTPDGKPAGYIEFWDVGEPHVRLQSWDVVHPEYQGLGIGTYLLDWVIDRARDNVVKAPQDTRVTLGQGVLSTNQEGIALLERKGFTHVRTFYRMRIDFDQQPPEPVIPAGIVIRPIEKGEEERAMRAAYDSFHDHWGFVEEPFENYSKRWLHYLSNDKDYDPSLWFMALDGEQVAGVSLCRISSHDDKDMGWVGTLGVNRPWRKQGLGLALLQHSFVELHKRGKPRVGLGVDATSLTGATRLYERAGMRVARQHLSFEMELRAGKDLSTQTVA